MITKHLFGLIECYSEQGRCLIEFNEGLLLPIYVGLGFIGLWLLFVIYDRYRTGKGACDVL